MAHPVYTIQCEENKIPQGDVVYASGIGAIAIPAWAREFQVHNRSGRDLILTWTSTNGGSGRKGIPALGTDSLSLTESPDESTFATIVISLGSYGSGTISPNSILINFKN